MRDQRASAIFWAVRPIFAGKRMRIRSHCGRPQLELRHFLKATGAADEDAGQQVPVARHEVRHADGELGDHRQLAAELLEDPDEHGDDERDQREQHAEREHEHDGRVGHRGLDLAAQVVVLLELVGDPLERLLEHAAGLAGAHHGDVERVEDLRVLVERLGEGEAGLDVLADGAERLLELLVLDLLLEDVERPQERHARGDHGRQLAGHDRQLLGLDLLGPERELHLEPGLLLDQVHHGQAAGLQLGGDRLAGDAGDLALLGRAGRVDGLEAVGGGRHQAATSDSRLDELAHLGGLGGAALGGGHGDPALADEPGERGVHRLHAVLAARLDQRVDLVRLALADQVAHARGRDEHLGRDAAAEAVGGRDQRLGHDALEADRQLRPDLALLGRREDVDDAVHGLRRVLGVQRGEDEVAGLGRGQGRADRLHVAHLADEDHVGVLAQRGLQAEREGRRVRPQLALVDDALLVVVQELDRVLDREDVLVARLVDLVDDRGERRRLARARRARDEHDAARLLGERRG